MPNINQNFAMEASEYNLSLMPLSQSKNTPLVDEDPAPESKISIAPSAPSMDTLHEQGRSRGREERVEGYDEHRCPNRVDTISQAVLINTLIGGSVGALGAAVVGVVGTSVCIVGGYVAAGFGSATCTVLTARKAKRDLCPSVTPISDSAATSHRRVPLLNDEELPIPH
jgi:hypothetical protein